MRIISGKHRSRKLFEFEGMDIRPTSDRVKESIFNIFQNKIIGSRTLDLFSGTGNLGIEAISRGAKSVVFCDRSVKSVELIKKNLDLLKESGEILSGDYSTNIARLRDGEKFDIIFIDPPYLENLGAKVIEQILEKDILKKDGRIILERATSLKIEELAIPLLDTRKYGETSVDIFGF